MARSYGSAATLLIAKETTYGQKPSPGSWEKFAFISSDLSAEQNLITSDLLGQGREPRAPFRDIINDEGNITVPVETRDFGRWLQFLLGNPKSEAVAKSSRFNHTYVSGTASLPSFSIQIGHENIPAYFVHNGCMLNSMAFNFQRSGTANCTLNIIAQGETRYNISQGDKALSRAYKPFSQFNGSIKRNGSPLGNVTGAQFTYSNGMQSISTIRSDALIEGVDPTIISATGSIEVRFADTVLLDDAINNRPIELELAYSLPGSEDFSLNFLFHEVYLPRPRIPVNGPGGVQAGFNWQAAFNESSGKSVTVTLKNDVGNYA